MAVDLKINFIFGKKNMKNTLKNKKGIVMLEAIPIIWIMFVFLGVTLGSWGIVHTAILHSIAARNHTYFMFNQRSDLSYLRDFTDIEYDKGGKFSFKVVNRYYRKEGEDGVGMRYLFIQSRGGSGETRATLRRVDFRQPPDSIKEASDSEKFISDSQHTEIKSTVGADRNDEAKVDPAWIMVGYGICLESSCGEN